MQENSLNPFKNEDTKNRNLFILLAVVFIIATIIIVIIYFTTKSNQHTGEVGNFVPPNAYFVNRTDLNRAIDTYPATDVLTNIEEVVLDETEISSAPSKNKSTVEEFERYTVTINNVSRLTNEPDLTYQATFNISDDRIYQATIREDSAWGSDYVCTILTRIDTKDSWLFINTNDSSFESVCKTWGNEKNYTFKNTKTSTLSIPER